MIFAYLLYIIFFSITQQPCAKWSLNNRLKTPGLLFFIFVCFNLHEILGSMQKCKKKKKKKKIHSASNYNCDYFIQLAALVFNIKKQSTNLHIGLWGKVNKWL